jgi:acyl-homoserine lactone acylase PvdQ
MKALLLCSATLLALYGGPARDPLADQVTIYRDEYGVPHIVGETEQATFFGYGYAQAQDHLERMLIEYRDAQGRRAEVLGFDALGQGYLRLVDHRYDGDYLQRLLRTKQAVVENKSKIDPDVYPILAAFARGVNAYIAEHRSAIPAWIDAVTAEDIEALERSQYFRYYSIHLALQKLTEPALAFPNFGSNQFALSPSRSADGRVIHVEHTHMPWANRFQNYEAHLITPGRLNAGGISWFGSPFFLDGFNDRITWSATSNFPNIADVYEEKLNPKDPLQYLYEGGWKRITVEYQTFRIKGPKGMESITLPLYYSHHGPIVKLDAANHRAYSVKLPNFDGVNYSANLYGLMKARNLVEFKAVLARQLMPKWSLLYTDSTNLYWVHNGTVARRAAGFNWRKPVPGWTKQTEWGPYIPFELYPQVLNPSSGFLQNCNDPPWVVTKNSGLKPLDPAPYYLLSQPRADAGEEALGSRGERLFRVLEENRKFTLDEVKRLSVDTYVLAANVIVPLLDEAARAASPRDSRIPGVMRQIDMWDRRSAKDSIAFTYLYFWGRSYQDLFTPRAFARFRTASRKQIDIHAPEEQQRALAALSEGLDRIQKHFGKIEVPWGDVNVVVRGRTFPMDGNDLYGVLHPDGGPEQENGQIHCDDGWGHLMIVVEGSPKEIWSLLPFGESEDTASPHFNDQAKLHSQGQIKRFWFTPQDILDHAESVWGKKDRIRQ